MTTDNDTRVADRAAHWFGRLLEGSADSKAFFDWLDESPRHVQELLDVIATAQALGALSPEQIARLEQAASSGSREAAPNIVPLSTVAAAALTATPTPFRSRRIARRLGLAAAAVASLAVATTWWVHAREWQTLSTAIGEQRIAQLPDGSIVNINTDSKIAVRFDESTRRIRLLKGQALFTVQHEPQRPFQVDAGGTLVQAVGTEFDVYRRATGGGTQVSVIEGMVQVKAQSSPDAQLLAAGEKMEISTQGTFARPAAVDTATATAWRQRRLVFERDSLADIAAEFNRYNAHSRIRVVGAAAQQHFSGTFNANQPGSIRHALRFEQKLWVEEEGDEIVIRLRETAGD